MSAPKKILIVEDNPMNMQLATDLLDLAGFTIVQAETGEQGVELARHESPDIILMDIGLPGINGLQAARLLKEDSQTRDIPVVALTAFAMKGDQEKARKAGCRGYITKPINTRTFHESVKGFMEKR